MTDNEIIKALEFCASHEDKMCCKCCSVEEKCELDGCYLDKKALDLITRQKAEVERLQIRNKVLTEITKNYDWKFANAKSEAIKEFAERLKQMPSVTNCEYEWLHLDIDSLAKELTEHKETVSMIDGHIEE